MDSANTLFLLICNSPECSRVADRPKGDVQELRGCYFAQYFCVLGTGNRRIWDERPGEKLAGRAKVTMTAPAALV
jgi:hypothetical protein